MENDHKEILYFNNKTKSMGLKVIWSRATAELMVALDLAMLQACGIKKNVSEEEQEKMIQDTQVREYSCKLAKGDKFDVNVAYAVLLLNSVCGSHRRREAYLKKRYGSLLNSRTYKLLVMTTAMELLHLDYDEFVKHVKEISVGEMPA